MRGLFHFVLLIAISAVFGYTLSNRRFKREAYKLPDGVMAYIPQIKPNFQCKAPGYFADIENDCKLFHVCVAEQKKDQYMQYTFACGNKTLFNQFSLTCAHESESLPCESSMEFFYLNERIGKEKELLHTEQDIEKLTSVFGAKM